MLFPDSEIINGTLEGVDLSSFSIGVSEAYVHRAVYSFSRNVRIKIPALINLLSKLTGDDLYDDVITTRVNIAGQGPTKFIVRGIKVEIFWPYSYNYSGLVTIDLSSGVITPLEKTHK